jgi:hypothetical protein
MVRRYTSLLSIGLFALISLSAVFSFPKELHADITSNLAGYWKFNDGSGSTAADSSGNGLTGTLQGTSLPTWITGQLSNALHFDGVDSKVSFTSTDLSTVNSASFWIDFEDSADGIALGGSSGSYFFYIDQTNVYYSAGLGKFVTVAHGGLSSGVWNHLAVTRNGTTVTFYKNGSPLGSPQVLGSNSSLVVSTIGAYDTAAFPTQAKMDDVRIYTRALSSGDVAELYAFTDVSAPAVTTNSASGITATAATLNGAITNTGGANATQSGFAYSTSADLTSGVSTSTLGAQSGTASFNSPISSLSGNTTYYFRAYATNSSGTGYGSIANFMTSSASGRAALSKPPNNLGLVGYWSFDEGTGTIATDFSGNRNHGTLTNGPAWVNGKRGKALSFSGVSDDHVSISDNNAFSFTNGSGTDRPYSLSAWAYIDDISLGGGLISKVTDISDFEWVFSIDPTGPYLGIGNVQSTGGTIGRTAPLTIGSHQGKWIHVAATYSGSETSAGMKLYINGVQSDTANSNAGTYTGMANGTAPVTIAKYLSGSLAGKMDEVRIYSRELSAAEVTKLYSSGAVKFTTSSVALQQGSSLASGLVGHWTFDGPDMFNNVADRSGNGNNGFLGGFTSTTTAIGKLGQAMSWTVNDSRIDIGSAASLDDIEDQGGGGMSGAAWVYRTGGGISSHILSAATDCEIQPALNDGRWSFGIRSGAPSDRALSFCKDYITTNMDVRSAAGDIPNNTWTHIAFTWDGSATAANVHLYINGAEVSSYSTQVNGAGAKTSDAALTKYVTNGQFTGGGDFLGRLDDVRLYKRILSPAEIKQLYNLGSAIIKR